jgi:DNA-binding CsgD family transcriptional regulator
MVPIYSRMIKKAYGLSNRETDVLELIIRGRDVARMAETLFVSENTVRSHCKNLYRKLDVHNRQQVFDLVEEFRQQEDSEHVRD